MYHLTLNISDEVFGELKSEVGCKIMMGNLFGTIDGVALKIVNAIDNSRDEIDLVFKKEKN